MRVMFWLSRASAPLWRDSNFPSNAPLCVTLHFALYLSISRIPGAHKAYWRYFEFVNTIERNDLELRRLFFGHFLQ
jgi:hypothetical protein